MILRDTSEEEILAEMEKLREEQRQFEEATRKLGDEAADSSAKKEEGSRAIREKQTKLSSTLEDMRGCAAWAAAESKLIEATLLSRPS